IVGDGPERANLADLVGRLGLKDRGVFWGSRPPPEPLETFAACHVLVHPTFHDSGGWVCLEAMAAGKPVICLDLGGSAELVTDRTGIKGVAKYPEQAGSGIPHEITL